MQRHELLKKDLFGEIWRQDYGNQRAILRDAGQARWWLRPVARMLLRREARALAALDGLHGVPRLFDVGRSTLARSYIDGESLYRADAPGAGYFRDALRLLRALHVRGVAHNDLAKEPNLVVTRNGQPAFLDYQLASASRRRGRLFRIAAREDLRHLLKHKRTYAPEALTRRQQAMLDTPSLPSWVWMHTVKPVYLFVTRTLMGWSDREGAGDRGRRDG
ncbi:MAG: serine/threonine protein kinase [Pseudomonadota bacterium]